MSDVKQVADILFKYLYDVIYNSAEAELNIEKLPEEFQTFGRGLQYYSKCMLEARALAQDLAKGDLYTTAPPPDNEIAAPLKSLQASLRHLTWQTQQVAQGDYQQRVEFLGEFATAFNSMTHQLEKRRVQGIREKSELQKYIDLILANTPDLFMVFDTDGNAILVNEAYVRCSKISSAESVKGMSFSEVFSGIASEEFFQCMDSLFNEALRTGNTVKVEQSIDFGQDGNPRVYLINVTPMLSEDEAVMGIMVVFHDTTEIIQARSEAEDAREMAEQSTQAKSDFLARMSHEMRTPMNAIIGMSSIGIETPDIGRKDYALQRISDASTHLLGVINDILDMSKIEANKFELSYTTFNFRSMLSHVMSIISFQLNEKEQNITVEIDDDIPQKIKSDEQHLAQVITNLLSNAVKFTQKNGSIILSAKKISMIDDSCTIRFMVKDNGIGISEEQQKNLFAPFEQADGSISRKFGGTGLGLAISKRIVEMMGGAIWVQSAPGNGSSFMFDVITRCGEEADTVTNCEDVISIGEFAGRRVLVAEDVDINREIVSALLEDTGVDISFANDGKEVVEKFFSAPSAYELILMDIQMPNMDGYEATRRIRASGLPEADSIPIIAMTANVFNEDIQRCLSSGMNGHLGKPVNVKEVIAKFKEYLPPVRS